MKEVLKKNEENKKINNPYYVKNTAKNYYIKTKEILNQKPSVLKAFYDMNNNRKK